jgi:hypothetical protein
VLFNRIDADDPSAATPTFDHLRAGLVRVNIKLADNLDVIDLAGNVRTNADRTVSVWRSVPTIENTSYTAPYQLDGRETNLEQQAIDALRAHSQITQDPPALRISQIADFEKLTYSDPRAAIVGAAIALHVTPPALDLHLTPGTDAYNGQTVFTNICARCHGSPTVNQIIEQPVFDSFFPVQHADGTIDLSGVLPTGIGIAAQFMTNVPRGHMGTLGISALGGLAQLGVLPNPSGLVFPTYRIRFYTDATRRHLDRDLPPLPPAIGVDLTPMPFSLDPGRALVSGDPIDWEGFDVPQLRGIAKTAPYFHDNSQPDLRGVVDEYSRLIIPADPVLNLPAIYPPEGPGLPPESITPVQKRQLLAFLQLL